MIERVVLGARFAAKFLFAFSQRVRLGRQFRLAGFKIVENISEFLLARLNLFKLVGKTLLALVERLRRLTEPLFLFTTEPITLNKLRSGKIARGGFKRGQARVENAFTTFDGVVDVGLFWTTSRFRRALEIGLTPFMIAGILRQLRT